MAKKLNVPSPRLHSENNSYSMKYILPILIFSFISIDLFAQEEETIDDVEIEVLSEDSIKPKPHRRAYYYEAFKEVDGVIDSMVIYKSKRMLQTYHRGKKMKLYMVSLGMHPIGAKRCEGDMKTPEGLYRINEREAISSYHKNLGISYPNRMDSIRAAKIGKSPGGEIKIHGFPNKHRMADERELMNTDWTLGCIAVTDHEIDELFTWVRNNCPILILP